MAFLTSGRYRPQKLYLGPGTGRVSELQSRYHYMLIHFIRFVLQLISLAGLHSNAVTTCTHCLILFVLLFINDNSTVELSSRFKEDGMLAYVELIQRKEKELGCDVLTHQKWLSTVSHN